MIIFFLDDSKKNSTTSSPQWKEVSFPHPIKLLAPGKQCPFSCDPEATLEFKDTGKAVSQS